MKAFLVLSFLIFSSISFASYIPLVEVSTSNTKAIHVVISNDSGMDLKCKYSVSWLVDIINFRKEFGKLNLVPNDSAEIIFKNEPYSHLSKIKAKVICE